MSGTTPRRMRLTRRRIGGFAGALAVLVVCLTAVSSSGAAGGPTNTDAPSVTGTAQEGKTLTTTVGTWTGTGGTISYVYHWQRCNPDTTACADIIGATSPTYTIGSADVGNTIRSMILATDTTGTASQASATSATVIAAPNLAPGNSTPATITGAPASGQILTAGNGTWTGASLTYTYVWQLCDATGAACQPIAGATAPTYTLTPAAIGKTLRVQVTASNASGAASSTSVPTAVIGAAGPATLIKLPNGLTSIDASEVKLPNRLILSKFRVQQTQPLHSRAPFRVTFTVTDTRGYVVRNSLVYLIGLPYNRILNATEARSGQDGTASFELTPTKLQPLKVGARLVIFARARVEGDSLLSGASTRRLVEVVFGAPR
jgi:hypothetical protein